MLVMVPLPEESIDQIRRIAPNITIHRLRREVPTYADVLPRADIIVGWPAVEDLPRALRLRWLQLAGAGANRYVDAVPPEVILTNASGVFGIPIAEHVLAMMLALTRAIPDAVRDACQARWSQQAERAEIFGATCGILGLGDIGLEVARRAKAFGMRVLAIKRQLAAKPDFIDELWDLSALDRVLGESDHLVNTLPGTPHTLRLLDADRISRMKRGACLYNVGRGSTLDEAALIAALHSGRLAGAGLDVFEHEPLPATNPLWRMRNVIITPHRAGQSPRQAERFGPIVVRNTDHFIHAEPLDNVVDRQWGY